MPSLGLIKLAKFKVIKLPKFGLIKLVKFMFSLQTVRVGEKTIAQKQKIVCLLCKSSGGKSKIKKSKFTTNSRRVVRGVSFCEAPLEKPTAAVGGRRPSGSFSQKTRTLCQGFCEVI